MTGTASANPWKARLAWLWSSLKSQWLATALIIPLGFFMLQTHTARQDAKEARVQAVNIDRITKIQDSGRSLDLALAAYFQSISQLGLAERHLTMPGTYKVVPVEQAQAEVVERREEARTALAEHASDIQRLRGNLDPTAARQYMTALAKINEVIEQPADIDSTGKNITALSKLVVSRNDLVDQAMNKVAS